MSLFLVIPCFCIGMRFVQGWGLSHLQCMLWIYKHQNTLLSLSLSFYGPETECVNVQIEFPLTYLRDAQDVSGTEYYGKVVQFLKFVLPGQHWAAAINPTHQC